MFIDYRSGGHWDPRADLRFRHGRRWHGWRHGEPYAAIVPEPNLSWGQYWRARRAVPSWIAPPLVHEPVPVFRTPPPPPPHPLPPPEVSADPPSAPPRQPRRPRDPQPDGDGRAPSQQPGPEPPRPGAEPADPQQGEYRFGRSFYRPLFDFRREERYRDRGWPSEGEISKPVPGGARRFATPRRMAGAAPPVTVHYTESQLKEWIEKGIEGAHIIGSVAEVIEIFHASEAWPAIEASLAWGEAATAGAGAGAVAALTAIAVPVGYVALMAFVGFQLYKAFTTGTRIQTKMGYCYGIVWAALGMSDLPVDYESRGDWVALGGNTIAELREAFNKGVNSGRDKFASDVKLHNQILLRLAYEQMTQSRHGWTEPGERVLDLLWAQVHGDDDTRDSHLNWVKGSIGTTYRSTLDDDSTHKGRK